MNEIKRDLQHLGPCPRCHARGWTNDPEDLFIRDLVECQGCGFRIDRRSVEPVS